VEKCENLLQGCRSNEQCCLTAVLKRYVSSHYIVVKHFKCRWKHVLQQYWWQKYSCLDELTLFAERIEECFWWSNSGCIRAPRASKEEKVCHLVNCSLATNQGELCWDVYNFELRYWVRNISNCVTCLGVPSIATIFISLFSFLHHYMFRALQAILRWNIHSRF
jgi:hypothetical protein